MPPAADLCVDIIKIQTGRLCQEGAGERPRERVKACGPCWASEVRGDTLLALFPSGFCFSGGILFIF